MAGDASEATANFGRAKELFGVGQYHDAMRLLVDLDRKFPNTRNILLAMAACLEKLDCLGEAEQICDRLLALGPDPKAAEIKARINAARTTPDIGALYAPMALDTPPREHAPRPPAPPAPTDRRRMILTGAVVLAAVLLLAVPLVLGRGRQATVPAAPAAQQAQTAAVQTTAAPAIPGLAIAIGVSMWIVVLVIWLIGFLVSIAFLFYYLSYTNRLHAQTFWGNIQDIALTQVIMMGLSVIPLIGWIFALVYFMQHYDIGCLEVILITLLSIVVHMIFMALVVLPFLLLVGHMTTPAVLPA